MQVEMLKGLTTRLASTAADMEKEIVDNRCCSSDHVEAFSSWVLN
jgi:hypothetical protein